MNNVFINKNNVYLGNLIAVFVIILGFGFIANLKLFFTDSSIKNGLGLLFHFLTIIILLVKIFILFCKKYEIKKEGENLIISTQVIFKIKHETKTSIVDIEYRYANSYMKTHYSSHPIAQAIIKRKEMLRRLFSMNCRNYVINKSTGKRLINDLSDDAVLELKKIIRG